MPESVQRSVRFVQFRRLYTICTSAKSTDLAELIPSHHPSSSVFFFEAIVQGRRGEECLHFSGCFLRDGWSDLLEELRIYQFPFANPKRPLIVQRDEQSENDPCRRSRLRRLCLRRGNVHYRCQPLHVQSRAASYAAVGEPANQPFEQRAAQRARVFGFVVLSSV